jgi:hypothetical protein
VIPYRPLGIGIGGTSVGAWRFNADLDLPPIDSYFISTMLTCGIPAALLFMWILFRATRMSWRGLRHADARAGEVGADEVAWREARVWRIAATLMPVLILNSFFGNTFTLYSVAPVGWLLVGWISASSLRQASEES